MTTTPPLTQNQLFYFINYCYSKYVLPTLYYIVLNIWSSPTLTSAQWQTSKKYQITILPYERPDLVGFLFTQPQQSCVLSVTII